MEIGVCQQVSRDALNCSLQGLVLGPVIGACPDFVVS